jgi:hypothetical protein
MASKSKSGGEKQHRKFAEAARKLGTDDSEDAFDKALRKVASAPPPKSVQKRKAAKKKR